jgi:hypothetical protein
VRCTGPPRSSMFGRVKPNMDKHLAAGDLVRENRNRIAMVAILALVRQSELDENVTVV